MDPTTRRLQALMLGHGALVMIAGMLAGFALTFSLLESINIWPFPAIEAVIGGSPRGWVAAHTGCIMNGLMVIGVGLALPVLDLRERALPTVAWGLILTGWANTCFYLFANLAPNRGLTMGANRFGEGGLSGVLAFTPALIGAYVVIVALTLAARAAFRVAALARAAQDD
jgi:hypothetical protein